MNISLTTKVLVFGKAPHLMEIALKALSDAGISAICAFNEDEIQGYLTRESIALIAIGNGVDLSERQSLKGWITREAPNVRVLEIPRFSMLVELVLRDLTQQSKQ